MQYFVFSTAVVPGHGDDSVFGRGVIPAVLGDADHASVAALRRLHSECHTLTAAESKRRTENTESDVPQKLPLAEVSSRIDALQTETLPLLNRGQPRGYELVLPMVEDQRVRYLVLGRVMTRDQEVNSLEEFPSFRMLQPYCSGMLNAVASRDTLRARVDTELEVSRRCGGREWRLSSGLHVFSAHGTLVCFLIRDPQKEPLPGFSRVSLTQVHAADRECHVQLARLTRAGFSTPGAGNLPLDDHLATVLRMASIHWILMPTRLAGKSAQPTAEDHESTGEETGPRKRKKENPVKETEVPPPPPPPEGQPERKSCVVSGRKGFAEGCRGSSQ